MMTDLELKIKETSAVNIAKQIDNIVRTNQKRQNVSTEVLGWFTKTQLDKYGVRPKNDLFQHLEQWGLIKSKVFEKGLYFKIVLKEEERKIIIDSHIKDIEKNMQTLQSNIEFFNQMKNIISLKFADIESKDIPVTTNEEMRNESTFTETEALVNKIHKKEDQGEYNPTPTEMAVLKDEILNDEEFLPREAKMI